MQDPSTPTSTPASPGAAEARRATRLLAIGATVGLALAMASLMSAPGDPNALGDGVVARVNDTTIRAEDYLRAVAALASDRRNPLTEDDRRRVLDRLIDEELLVQHALALGLAKHDRRVRADLVSSVMGSLVATTDGFEASESELTSFYEENRDYFTRPGRLRVRQIFNGVGSRHTQEEARDRAERAAARLAKGDDFATVKTALGDVEIAPVPDALLPPAKLRNYLGPTVLRTAYALDVGAASDPLRSAQGYHVLVLVARKPATLPALADIEREVRAEMKRRAGDQAVRDRLDSLRRSGEVIAVETLP